jgi:Cd2+-exporting ATPase
MDSLSYDTEKALCHDPRPGLDHVGDQYIDVVLDNLPVFDRRLRGVKSISKLAESTFRIHYDPHTVGARDLLERGFKVQPALASEDSTSSFAAQRRALRCLSLKTLLSILLTIPVLILAWFPVSSSLVLTSSISLFFASLLQILVATTFYSSAYIAIVRNHVADVDVLITLSTTTAYIFSLVAFVHQVIGKPIETGTFFQTSALLTTIVLIGRMVAEYSHQKAVETISIRSLQPRTAILVADDKTETVIDARLLQYGDSIKVLADSQIPTDGVVVRGTSEVDESMITGEANLTLKTSGSKVVAGSVNHQGILLVHLTRLPGENTISQIAGMTDEALSSKPKSREIADRVAAWFVPVIVLLSVATFAIWVAVSRVLARENWSHAVVAALTYAIAVLIVSCPCAIGLAVPMVLVIASGIGAKHGIIIKSGRCVEIARNVEHVVLDKTGTLTEGRPAVVHFECLQQSPELVQSLLLGLLSSSNHPISRAIAESLTHANIRPETIENLMVSTGNAISGTWRGQALRGGNLRWIDAEDHVTVAKTSVEGRTVFGLTLDEELVAVIGVEDNLRKEALEVVAKLKQRNIEVSLVSGDGFEAVDRVARTLGIPHGNMRSRASPAEKQSYIRSLLAKRTSSRRTPNVLFCVDGTNDSVALAQATIGVYMTGGTDIAKGAADVVLASPHLDSLLLLVDLSRASFNRIVLNFVWSFLYNVFAVLLAAGAFKNVGFRLEPQYAAIGELVSIVPVILVAFQLKLKHWKS